jgi:hypothetical protein
MEINFQAWDNFLGRSLIVFMVVEGLKTFPFIARASGGPLFTLLENFVVNLAFVLLSRKTGSDIFIGDTGVDVTLSVALGTLATAGLHRVKQAFERRSPKIGRGLEDSGV